LEKSPVLSRGKRRREKTFPARFQPEYAKGKAGGCRKRDISMAGLIETGKVVSRDSMREGRRRR